MGKEKISEKSSLKKSAYKSRKKQQSDASRETALKKNRPLELSKKKNSIKEPPMELSIKEIKELQIEILDYIDKLCRDNTIHYSLAYGTLIGAVRHQGYIPWDDDLDIILSIMKTPGSAGRRSATAGHESRKTSIITSKITGSGSTSSLMTKFRKLHRKNLSASGSGWI